MAQLHRSRHRLTWGGRKAPSHVDDNPQPNREQTGFYRKPHEKDLTVSPERTIRPSPQTTAVQSIGVRSQWTLTFPFRDSLPRRPQRASAFQIPASVSRAREDRHVASPAAPPRRDGGKSIFSFPSSRRVHADLPSNLGSPTGGSRACLCLTKRCRPYGGDLRWAESVAPVKEDEAPHGSSWRGRLPARRDNDLERQGANYALHPPNTPKRLPRPHGAGFPSRRAVIISRDSYTARRRP